MAMANAGNAGRIYQKSLVCATANTKITTPIHARIKQSDFKRLANALNAQSPAAKGKRIAQSVSFVAK